LDRERLLEMKATTLDLCSYEKGKYSMKTRPTIKMTALSDYRISRSIETYITFELRFDFGLFK